MTLFDWCHEHWILAFILAVLAIACIESAVTNICKTIVCVASNLRDREEDRER